ncbi:MAG: hypothetical protein FWD57_07810 [Polyangiaceae bacterium]|nr:hypothetical protein [Polyangiaceae bacterium]
MNQVFVNNVRIPAQMADDRPKFLCGMDDRLVIQGIDQEGQTCSVAVVFEWPRMSRYRGQAHCTEYHRESRNVVLEVMESDWVEEARADSDPVWRDHFVLRHFIIYIDGFGCLEVIARSVRVEDPWCEPVGRA